MLGFRDEILEAQCSDIFDSNEVFFHVTSNPTQFKL